MVLMKTILTVSGAVSVVIGVGFIYWPAALITGGIFAILLGEN
jgi:hypothetical protein